MQCRASPQRRQKLKSKCSDEHKDLTLILDCRTRWSSTHQMIERAILLQDAYSQVCSIDNDLSDYVLRQHEWDFLKSLCSLLEPFAKLTKRLSTSRSYASIPIVISGYNKLIDNIEAYRRDKKNIQRYSDICKAALASKLKLQKYYGKTDLTPVYAVGTALHPCRKFGWWKWKGWEKRYQDEAMGFVRKVWSSEYEPNAMTLELPPSTQEIYSDDDFDDLEPQQIPTGSELEQYVEDKTPVELVDKSDVFPYWRAKQEKWPTLTQMARDYLAIPATSTPSERCFSQARLVLPHTRNRLGPAKISQLLLMNAWQKHFH